MHIIMSLQNAIIISIEDTERRMLLALNVLLLLFFVLFVALREWKNFIRFEKRRCHCNVFTHFKQMKLVYYVQLNLSVRVYS